MLAMAERMISMADRIAALGVVVAPVLDDPATRRPKRMRMCIGQLDIAPGLTVSQHGLDGLAVGDVDGGARHPR